MKVYLAAPYAARDLLKQHVPRYTANGHIVTCGWVNGTRPLGAATYGISAESSDAEVAAHARMDIADILKADAVVHYSANYISRETGFGDATHQLHSGGRHVETGVALATNKPVIVIGQLENIFQRGMCYRVDDLRAALVLLDELWALPARPHD